MKTKKTIMLFFTCLFASFTAMGQVCQIGSTAYATLDDALSAVADGQTITLLADITYKNPIDLGDKSISFNLGNNLYSLTIDASATPGSAAITTAGSLTITGSGFFNITAADVGIHLTGTDSGVLRFNHSAATTIIQTTGTGANTTGILLDCSSVSVSGNTSLRIYASGTSGDGIRLNAADAGITFMGSGSLGLDLIVHGAGAGHGLNFTAEGNHIVNINTGEQYLDGSTISGGDTGNGVNYQGTTGTLYVDKNTGYGSMEFRGVNGIYTKSNLDLKDYTGNSYSQLTFSGGDCGIKMDNTGKILDVSGQRGIGLSGGSTGLWLKGNTTINTGNSNFAPKGGSGIYVDSDETTLTISTTSQYVGSKWFAPSSTNTSGEGYGIYAAGALTLAQSGSYRVDVKAQGGNTGEGIFIGGGKDLTLSGNLTAEAIGGANAQGMNLSGAGKVNITDSNQKLTIDNNAGEESVPCSRTSALASLFWTTTGDGNISAGDDDASENVSFVVSASTGTAKTATIFLSNGVPVISTSGTLPFGIANTPYSTTLLATNNATSWTVASGTLPEGLTLDNTGKITGTPTATGYFSFTVTASGQHGTSSPVTLYISIQEFVAVSDIILNTLPSISINMLPSYLYSGIQPYNATYYNITWSVVSAGTTGAYIDDDGYGDYSLNATATGKVTLRATIVNGTAIGVDFTKDFTFSITDIVCEIVGGDNDGTQYQNLQDAIWSAGSGGHATIRLLDDIYAERAQIYNEDITFDLNGYDLTVMATNGEGGISLQDSHVDYTGTGNFKAIGRFMTLYGNSSCKMTSFEINQPWATGVNGGSCAGDFSGDVNIDADAENSTGFQLYESDLTISGNVTMSADNCTGIIAYSSSHITMTGNIIASGNNGVAVSAADNSQVTIDGRIEGNATISINYVTKTLSEKEAVSSKPGYDEYTDGDSYVWVKTPVSSGFTWQGITSDWDDEQNWSGGTIPGASDNVLIPSVPHFPVLNQTTSVAEIHFEPGAQIGNQHYLEGKAFVQYDLKKSSRWNMLSIPLEQVYPGDFTFGGYPVVFVRTFQTRASSEEEGSITKGVWVTARGDETSFSFGNGFVLWLNEDNSTVDKGLKLLNGVRELPFFRRQASGSPDKELYDKVHQAHDYDAVTGESTFYDVLLSAGEYVRDENTHYTVTRDDGKANQLAGETVSKALNFGTNTEAKGEMALVGNPYMATLDFEFLYAANTDAIKPCYQVWTGEGYETYTGYGYAGSIDPEGNTLNRYIAPLQGFLVEKPEAPESESLTVTEAMTAVNADAALRSSSIGENKLDIIAKNPAGEVLTFIAKREGGQDTFGNLDARKIMNGLGDSPEVYTLKPYKGGSIATAVNIINNDELLIPVGLATSYTGNITLSFSGMDAYDAQLSFIDVAANKEISLTGLASFDYLVNYMPEKVNGEVAACEDRFFIRISKMVTGMTETAAERVNVYESNGLITIISCASDPIKEAAVYDLHGTLLYKAAAIHAISCTIDRNLPAGVYVVKVTTEKNTDNVKVVLR